MCVFFFRHHAYIRSCHRYNRVFYSILSNATSGATEEEEQVLGCFRRTFQSYIIKDPASVLIRDELLSLEASLSQERNGMKLGYVDPVSGSFEPASSVQLRNTMRTSKEASLRLACYAGLRSIGDCVAGKLAEIVKLRNKLAKAQGYEDYYDMKCTQAEGFSKRVLFGILDDLATQSRPILARARSLLAERKGSEAIEPQNMSYFLSGEHSISKNPYFPFENAVDVWSRSFAALGITYRGATMQLDLCDRQGKYSNGFCHWPQPAWLSKIGSYV